MQTLSGRTCVFNGANGGDGTAAVKALCAAGMNVVMITHFPERAKALIAEIEASGAPGVCYAFSNIPEGGMPPEPPKPPEGGRPVHPDDGMGGPPEASDETYQKIVEMFGSVDVIICNSGSNGKIDDIETMTAPQFMDGVQSLLEHSYGMVRAALPYLRQSKAPRVILMTTVEGCSGGTHESLANAVGKGAVRSLAVNLAARLAKDGIPVNCISKGAIQRMETPAADEPKQEGRLPLIPLGRLGGPEDVANAVCFLASEECGYITGQILELSGGMNLGR